MRHVRRLILRGVGVDDGFLPEHNPYLSLEQCERSDDDTDIQSCFDLYFRCWGLETEVVIQEGEWESLSWLMRQLPGLTDMIYACPGPFPLLLLRNLHEQFVQQGVSRCRLHHYTF